MADTTNIPGAGPVNKKLVIGGVALVAGVVGWAYLHRSQAVAGPDVGSEGDLPVGTELPPADVGSVSTGGGTSDTGIQFITTNAQWTADAVGKMTDLGFDAVAVSTALGKYLANQFVTAQEALYVQTALAVSGKPPDGEHSIRLEPTPTSTSGSAPPGTRPTTTTVWQGHRVETPQSLHDFSRVYATSKTATGIESTYRALILHNPTIYARYGRDKRISAGSVIMIPVRK